MSDQPGPSSGRRSDQDPPDLSDESDSEFEESSSGSSTSGSENDYEEGGDVFTYEITDKAAKFISKYFGSEVDYKLTPSSDGNFTCELTTTPDNRELHTSVLSGLDLALNLWPFGYLLQTLASETEDAFQTLFLDNTEKLVIIIEFCKLFNNHASSTWQEILDDKDKLMCMELNIRNILEYDDYTELGLATFVAELRTHFEEQESWKRAAEVLAEKQLDRLIPFLMGSRLSQKSADVLNLRLVSKTFQQKVDVVLKDNIFVQSLCRKKTLGIIEIDETRIETIPYSKTANPILHCDKTTLKKLLPFVSLPNNGDFSFAYQSETAKKLVESLNLTEKSEVEIAGKKYNLAQGTLSHGSLTEVVDQFIGNDSANNNLKRENADIVDEIPAKTQRSE
ncbi:unnamed protein product [Bursaphelenchus xylophilus]|uniref:(pine wood nematode) hypothetical protein n=1 Tax=Bursaphelenchus xylophilus TaxID=6326 RepID=A0A1I7RW60_BURXY|nr:unnamed protein product [Bursaphelenchus xylophilus]CAG9095173.1 unnamed protein product [Bursaphelenchus xylophilus]